MAITIKCTDCGYTKQSEDGDEETCPRCDGSMAAPAKKKYQAKSTSIEEESRAKKKSRSEDEKPKSKARLRSADEDDEKPKPGKKARDEEGDEEPRKKALALDDEDDEDGGEDYTTDGKAAKQLDLDPGFKNRALMKQVADELARGEVLHYVCRPSPVIARKQGLVAVAGGVFFAVVAVIVAVIMLTGMKDKVPVVAVIVPGIFVLVGIAVAILGPIMKNRQARLGWYAVTDRRAIVFNVGLWGTAGQVETYLPSQLRKMWVKKSFWLKGGGDLVFKTIVTQRTRTERDRTTGRTRTSTSTSTQHFGFIGIEDVKDVETLIHEVLLSKARDDEDEDDDD